MYHHAGSWTTHQPNGALRGQPAPPGGHQDSHLLRLVATFDRVSECGGPGSSDPGESGGHMIKGQ